MRSIMHSDRLHLLLPFALPAAADASTALHDIQSPALDRLIARASKLVVMSERSRDLLRSVYRADEDQIALIAHGVPDRPFGRQKFA